MDNKWRDALKNTGKALFNDIEGIRSEDKDMLWEVYVTFLAQKQCRPEIEKEFFFAGLEALKVKTPPQDG